MSASIEKPPASQPLPHPSHDARDAVEASDSPLKQSAEQLRLLKRSNMTAEQMKQKDIDKKSL